MVLWSVGRLISCGLLVAACVWHAGAQVAAPAASVAPADSAAASAAALPPPATEVAPKAPKVTCKGNELTIAAENSTMESVLTAVRACTGALIDVPEPFGSERTYMQLGPAPAREVLESLLSSTEYNYVIELSETEPGKIHSVLLMARADDADHKDGRAEPGEMQLTPARRAWLEMRRNARPAGATGDDAQSADTEATAVAVAETPKTVAAEASTPAEVKPEAAKADAAAAATAAAAPVAASSTAPGTAPDTGPDGAKTTTTAAVAPAAEAAAPSDSSDTASKEMQNRISTMQQLFEQRKQMIQGQGAVAKPQ